MGDVGTHSSGGATTVFDKTTKDRKVTGRERKTPEAGASILSVISKDMQVQGNCDTDGQLRIEGKIIGNVTAQGVEVVASGSVDGDVIAAGKSKSTQVFIITGLVTGAVQAARVEVRSGGKVHGGVIADEAVIHGKVHGGILARQRLALEETAEVEGDVHARLLSLKEGGQVNGNINMGERANLESSGKKSAPVANPVEVEDDGLAEAAQAT